MFELIIDDGCTDMLNASLAGLSIIINDGTSLVYGSRHGSCPYSVGIPTTPADCVGCAAVVRLCGEQRLWAPPTWGIGQQDSHQGVWTPFGRVRRNDRKGDQARQEPERRGETERKALCLIFVSERYVKSIYAIIGARVPYHKSGRMEWDTVAVVATHAGILNKFELKVSNPSCRRVSVRCWSGNPAGMENVNPSA